MSYLLRIMMKRRWRAAAESATIFELGVKSPDPPPQGRSVEMKAERTQIRAVFEAWLTCSFGQV
jgi:hypothetical protein